MQEQKLGNKKEQIIQELEKHTNHKIFESTEINNPNTILTCVKLSIVDDIQQVETIIPGRAQRIRITRNGLVLNFINIYGPAKEKNRHKFYKTLFE